MLELWSADYGRRGFLLQLWNCTQHTHKHPAVIAASERSWPVYRARTAVLHRAAGVAASNHAFPRDSISCSRRGVSW